MPADITEQIHVQFPDLVVNVLLRERSVTCKEAGTVAKPAFEHRRARAVGQAELRWLL
jgi:hypothetical protein